MNRPRTRHRAMTPRALLSLFAGLLTLAGLVVTRLDVRGAAGDAIMLAQVALAASVAGVPLAVSLSPDAPPAPWLADDGIELAVEAEAGFVERLARPQDAERLRVWAPISTAARATANGTGVAVADAPVLANGRLELRWYLREQAVSRVVHRYGNVTESAPTA